MTPSKEKIAPSPKALAAEALPQAPRGALPTAARKIPPADASPALSPDRARPISIAVPPSATVGG